MKLPFGHGRSFGANYNRIAEAAISRWQANCIAVYQTGTPFTVTTSKDISNTGASNFANLVPGQNPSLESPTPLRWFNTGAFSDTLPVNTFAYGSAGRNLLRSDGPVNLDLGVYRRIPFVRETAFQFRAEFFNVLNHPTFANPTVNVQSASFGQVSSTSNSPRQTQFAVKYLF